LRADDRALADLASSVADGAPVDWTTAETLMSPAQRRLVRHLKLVESIAVLHRSIPSDVPPQPAAAATVPDEGPRWGRLVLLERIGQGMSGDVHRARDLELHREVALKLLHDAASSHDAHRRVLDEARRLARMRHPHVVQVYGAEQHDGRVGLWMELVQGESLEHMVKTRGRFGAHEAAMVGLDLCSALAAVHGAGLLHRDIKAQNVIREAGGRIVLMDFGTGEELRQNAGSSRMVGTPLYLAPEVFRGKPATSQSDIYSLGVLLFYLVTGQFPVTASSMIELGKAHSSGRRRRLRDVRPDLPSSFVGAVEHALEPDPSQRFASAGEMESALRRSLDSKPAVVADTPLRLAFSSWSGFAGVVAALLVLVVALIVWSRQPGTQTLMSAGAVRIAVLPLSDLSPSPVAPYLADALTDELISTLGQIHTLSVTSLTSASRYRHEGSRDAATIARELGVDRLLEGTVLVESRQRGASPRVRVNVRLIAAGTHTTLWKDSFERVLGDTFAIQTDIARAIAGAVDAALTPRESARLGQSRQTNPAAEEAYLQGRVHLTGYGNAAARRALEAFERAVQQDARHAAAHAGVARAIVRLGLGGEIAQNDARARGLTAVRSALEIDPGLAEAHAVAADIRFLYDWDLSGAEREYRRSLELNPSFTYARTYYAQALSAQRRHEEAVAQSLEAQRLDPQSGEALRTHGLLLYYKRDYKAAAEVFRTSTIRDPDSAAAFLLLGRVAEAEGQLLEALEHTARAVTLSDGGGVPLRVQHVRLQMLAGLRAEGQSGLDTLMREAAARTIRVSPRDLGYLFLAMGRTDDALRAFERSIEERDPSLIWLGVDPRVDSLRSQPRFRAILGKTGIE
jgi:serine/threonine protein kinase/tetratricopeptide (TPR) repeat protein